MDMLRIFQSFRNVFIKKNFFSQKLLILFARQSRGGKGREIFHLLTQGPHNIWGKARPRLRARISIWVSRVGEEDPNA